MIPGIASYARFECQMIDIVNESTRSKMMAGIKNKNTKPELIVRKALHATGFRYSLHDKNLPGKPDLVFPKYKAVIFIHGCFWHQHNCHLFKWPKTRSEFWKTKITGNVERDRRQIEELKNQGWRVLIIWECRLKGKLKDPLETLISDVKTWLLHGNNFMEIPWRPAE